MEEMIGDEVMKPFNSPWLSSVALVKRSDGSRPLCIDERKVNAEAKEEAFTLPHINDSLDFMYGCKIQVELVETDWGKTSHMVLNGLCELQKMPFALC
ncbi:Transposon Ty3-I Gag-Pol polyprotein [Taenia solium]|eukprot:TsM_000388600 transcript=TsM_000388600 gene=TsM_000388600